MLSSFNAWETCRNGEDTVGKVGFKKGAMEGSVLPNAASLRYVDRFRLTGYSNTGQLNPLDYPVSSPSKSQK